MNSSLRRKNRIFNYENLLEKQNKINVYFNINN